MPELVAYHEADHAFMALVLGGPIFAVPRSKASPLEDAEAEILLHGIFFLHGWMPLSRTQ